MSEQALPTVLELEEDLSTVEAPPPLPTGIYTGIIKDVKPDMSAKGNAYLSVSFHISPDQYPPDFSGGNPDGMSLVYRRVPWNVAGNQQAMYNLRRFIETIGAPMGNRIDINDWVGLEARITVEHEAFEGTTRAQIKKVDTFG